MYSSVLFVDVGSHKLLTTVLTLERFVSTMDDAMLSKVTAQRESLATLVTFERFLVGRVSTQVLVQRTLGGETLFTDLTREFVFTGCSSLFEWRSTFVH